MTPKAIFLGSIGAVAETSDIQRRAYNQALAEAGIDWQWDAETYRELLNEPGGMRRLARLSAEDGDVLSGEQVAAIHARKTEIACAEIGRGINLRPGVATLVRQALDAHIAVAFVTSTYRPNIDAIAKGAGDTLPLEKFAAVLTTEDCARGKPAPDVYLAALDRLDIGAGDAVAIEDSAVSVSAARAANLYTIATPGEFTAGQDFGAADRVLESLERVTVETLRPTAVE